MKISEMLGAVAIVRAGARASQSLSQAMLAGLATTAHNRVRPDLFDDTAPRQHRYCGDTVAPLSIRDAMDRFMAFAEDEMGEWRKVAAHTTADGTAVASYTARFSPTLPLRARSYWAQLVQNEHCRRGRGGSRLEARVSYRYHVRFELRALGPRLTAVSFKTQELIDPEFTSGYDLRRAFEVPMMPGGFGQVGERFFDSLPR